MKKTIDVNLAGCPFKMDEDAYLLLGEYLEKLQLYINDEQIKEEVLFDVESRLVELIQKRMTSNIQVVSYNMIQEAINIIGEPQNFATEHDDESKIPKRETTKKYFTKKLFRNPKNKIIGGVISGLCEYFRITQYTFIIRLLLVLIILFGAGSPILIYIIFWILIPEAKTPSDFIRMKGGDINVKNIETEVKNTFIKVGGKVENIGKSMRKWKISDKIHTILEIIVKMIGLVLLLACLGLLIGGIIFLLSFFILNKSLFIPVVNFFFLDSGTLILLNIMAIIIFVIPLFWAIYVLISILLNRKRENLRWVKISSGLIWGIALVYIIFSLVSYGSSFEKKEEKIQNFEWETKEKKEVILVVDENREENTIYFDHLKLKVNMDEHHGNDINMFFSLLDFIEEKKNDEIELKDFIGLENTTIFLYPSEKKSKPNIIIDHVLSARGKTHQDALYNVNNSSQEIKIVKIKDVDTIYLSKYIRINKAAKWRNQKVKIEIGIPENIIFKIISKHGSKVKVYPSIHHWLKREYSRTYYSLTYGELFTKDNRIYCRTCVD